MKNKFIKIFAITLSTITISAIFIILPMTTLALEYQALEPNAFAGFGNTNTGEMGPFLDSVFRFGLAIAAGLAVFMIAWGGIQYMTTDAWFGKEEAKGKIWNAIQGLLLALASWLILWIINPQIFSMQNLFIAK